MSVRRIALVAVACGLAACTGPQVRTLANGGGPPAYELRGPSRAQIEAEAAKLCAQGYEVLRAGARFVRPEPDDNPATQWLLQAGDWLSGMPGNEAQATIVCRA